MTFLKFYIKHPCLYYVCVLIFASVAEIFAVLILPPIVNTLMILAILSIVEIPAIKLLSMQKMLNNCDPVGYLNMTDELLSGVQVADKIKALGKQPLISITLNRSAAFIQIGRNDDALYLIDFLQRNVPKMSHLFIAAIYNNLSIIYSDKGDTALAEDFCERERIEFEENHLSFFVSNRQRKILAELSVKSNKLEIALSKGDFQLAETLGLDIENLMNLSNVHQLDIKTSVAFDMGAVYFNLKNYNEALPRLRFAAENGGTTVYVAKAREMLCEINNNQTI